MPSATSNPAIDQWSTEGPVLAEFEQIAERLRAFLATAEPGRTSIGDSVALLEIFTTLERLAMAGKTLFASGVLHSTIWYDEGHLTPATWLAERTGGTVGDALATLNASNSLLDLNETKDALRAGLLSESRVRELARVAGKVPASESDLLEVALNGTLQDLKGQCRQVLSHSWSAQEEQARYRAQKESRYLRNFLDEDGGVRLDGKLACDVGARVLAAVEAEAEVLFDEARKAGEQHRYDAYLADALASLVCGDARTGPRAVDTPETVDVGETTSSSKSKRAERRTDRVVLRVDATALRRGLVVAGEVCEISGVGPVPVSTARELLPAAFVEVLIHEGVDVLNVCRVGRNISAHLEAALEERDRHCVVPGCTVTRGLEKHHYPQDFAVSGTTSLAELARICSRHHDMITYGGFVLAGGPGAWTFTRSGPYLADFADTG